MLFFLNPLIRPSQYYIGFEWQGLMQLIPQIWHIQPDMPFKAAVCKCLQQALILHTV